MFLLIFLLHLFIQPAYAQTVSVPSIVPTVAAPIATAIPSILSADPTLPPTQTAPTQSLPIQSPSISEPSPTTIPPTDPQPTIAPTTIVTITPIVTLETTPGVTLGVTPGTTPTASPAATAVIKTTPTPWPTWTPAPIAPAHINPIDMPKDPAPTASIAQGVAETFQPDVKFPPSFLRFEKDGDYYKATSLSPSKTRWVLALALLIIFIGIALIYKSRPSHYIPNSQLTKDNKMDYATTT